MTIMVAESVRSEPRVVEPKPDLPRDQQSRPRPVPTDRILPGTRMLLMAFAVFTLLGAVVLSVFAGSTDQYFAWTIAAEPAAAFLGAAYAAGFVLSVLCLRRQRWSDVRIAVITVSAFTAVTLVATLLHLHKFHLMAGASVAGFAAWLWLAVYVVVPVLCAVVVVRQERRRVPARVRRPMPHWLIRLLAGQGVTLFIAGAVLFAGGATRHHHPMEWTGFWPLPVAPLAAQAAGAWLMCFGLAAALAIRERDLRRLAVPALSYAAFGVFQLVVVFRSQREVSATDPWLWAYLVLLVSIVVAGGYGWLASRAGRGGESIAHEHRSSP
jgi:hypothetical protein